MPSVEKNTPADGKRLLKALNAYLGVPARVLSSLRLLAEDARKKVTIEAMKIEATKET